MTLWSAEIKEIERLYDSIKGQSPELEKELERLINASDENMVLVYARRCLEVIITDLCESELKRPRKTEPLQGIIDKLNREEKIPSHIFASMQSLNSLSTFGSHPKEFDPRQVKPVLSNLTTIIEWYLKYKDSQIGNKAKAEEETHENKRPDDSANEARKSKKKLIIIFSGLLLACIVVIVALVLFNFIGGKKTELDKSIAVLPFKLLTEEPNKQYFADGMMDAILLHLSKIEDLRVMSRTSVEQYRETDKTSGVIGKELGVAYLLEGSFQKYGDNARLIVQLIKTGKEGHEWANEYDRNWKDIFSVQSEVAQTIARELDAVISPEEKQLIEKTPTISLTAYDFFQRGREENWKYYLDNDNREALESAEDLYHKALEYDSTFAQAYTGLAWIYWEKHYWESYLSEDFLDSVLILCDIALSYDDQLSEAYTTRGDYYSGLEKPEQAIQEYDKAIKFNPNDFMAYFGKGSLYENNDRVKSIDNLLKAASLYRGSLLPGLLRYIGVEYLQAGFIEKAKNYYQEAFKLDGDSMANYKSLSDIEFCLENYKSAIEFLEKVYAIDCNNINIQWSLGHHNVFLGQYKESLKYFKKWLEKSKTQSEGSLFGMHRIGWAYWKNGYKEEAEYYFNEQINYSNRMKELGRVYGNNARIYYDLAGVYAFMGEKEKAYENLRSYNNQIQIELLWGVSNIRHDPLFDSLRDEPEFQQIVMDLEAKYQAEHERVRKWLEEQGML